MAKTSYVNVGGEIFGEITNGIRSNYIRDALGSVVAVTDTSNNKVFTARYKPYGEALSSAGTVPSFTWVGVYGYLRSAGSTHNEFSVRARFYGSKEGRWAAYDPLTFQFLQNSFKSVPGIYSGLLQNGYRYVLDNPSLLVDPSGLHPVQPYDPGSSNPNDPWSNCILLSLSFPRRPPLTYSASGSFCLSCFDNDCCLPPVCSTVKSVQAKFGIGISLGVGQFLDVGSVSRTFSALFHLATSAVSSLIFGGANYLKPTKGCPKPQDKKDFQVCITGCLGLFKIEGCGAINLETGDITFPGGMSVGYCGLPSISGSISFKRKWCP